MGPGYGIRSGKEVWIQWICSPPQFHGPEFYRPQPHPISPSSLFGSAAVTSQGSVAPKFPQLFGTPNKGDISAIPPSQGTSSPQPPPSTLPSGHGPSGSVCKWCTCGHRGSIWGPFPQPGDHFFLNVQLKESGQAGGGSSEGAPTVNMPPAHSTRQVALELEGSLMEQQSMPVGGWTCLWQNDPCLGCGRFPTWHPLPCSTQGRQLLVPRTVRH